MSANETEMPPLKVAAKVLRETTERLAQEVAEPGDTVPQWSDLHWAIAPAAAAIHGISTLLHERLRWQGPDSWQAFLQDQREHSVLRHKKIAALLGRLDTVLRDADVGAVALKGSSLLRLGLYAEGERPMADVDLLVRPEDLELVEQALGAAGYRRTLTVSRHVVFKSPLECTTHGFGEHENNAVPIEVHTAVRESMPVRSVDITAPLWPPQARPGLNPYVTKSALMLHLLLHAAGNMRKRALRQIQMHDLALLAQHLDARDWDAIIESPVDGQPHWWIYPPLAITQQYFEGSIPQEIIHSARRNCPTALRAATHYAALSKVSFSNLRIAPFPGLTWSKTPFEAARLMIGRIVPSRTALKELGQGVDANPHLKQLPWYGISHAERILRWLSGRAPRVQTMLTLRAALDGAGQFQE